MAGLAYTQTTQEHNLPWFLLDMLLLFSQLILRVELYRVESSITTQLI